MDMADIIGDVVRRAGEKRVSNTRRSALFLSSVGSPQSDHSNVGRSGQRSQVAMLEPPKRDEQAVKSMNSEV